MFHSEKIGTQQTPWNVYWEREVKRPSHDASGRVRQSPGYSVYSADHARIDEEVPRAAVVYSFIRGNRRKGKPTPGAGR